MRQLNDIGAKAAVIGGDGLSNSEFWNIGAKAGEGTIFTNASDALKNEDSKAAAEALKAANIPAEAFTLNAYAAVEVLKAGIEKAGSAKDSEAVITALKSGDAFATAIGKVTYGEWRPVVAGFLALQVAGRQDRRSRIRIRRTGRIRCGQYHLRRLTRGKQNGQ